MITSAGTFNSAGDSRAPMERRSRMKRSPAPATPTSRSWQGWTTIAGPVGAVMRPFAMRSRAMCSRSAHPHLARAAERRRLGVDSIRALVRLRKAQMQISSRSSRRPAFATEDDDVERRAAGRRLWRGGAHRSADDGARTQRRRHACRGPGGVQPDRARRLRHPGGARPARAARAPGSIRSAGSCSPTTSTTARAMTGSATTTRPVSRPWSRRSDGGTGDGSPPGRRG